MSEPNGENREVNPKLLDRLKKLKAMAEGAETIGSEAEAQAFAAMFQTLLTKHKLEMSDVEFHEMEKEEPVGKHYINYRQYPDIRMRSHRIAWIETLATIIAEAHFCKILVHPNSSRITLVGRHSDCVVAEYMLVTLQRAIDKMSVRETDKYKRAMKRAGDRSQGNGFRSSWINGFIIRLAQRYREERAAAEGSSSMALVRVNKAEKDVVDFIEENVKKKAEGLSTAVRFHREGLRRGREAADAIELRGKAIDPATGRRSLPNKG